MRIPSCLEDVLLVESPRGCDVGEELKAVAQIVEGRVRRVVVADFSAIDILNTDHLAALLRLRQSLQARGHRLVFRNVGSRIREVLSITGLDAAFEIAPDGVEGNLRERDRRPSGSSVSAERPGW